MTTLWSTIVFKSEYGMKISFKKFNNGYSNIGRDDDCWIIYNGGKPSHYIFKEAMYMLRSLPCRVRSHPFMGFVYKDDILAKNSRVIGFS